MNITVSELINQLQAMKNEMSKLTGKDDFYIKALMNDTKTNSVYGIDFKGIYNDDNSYILLEVSN